MSTCNFHRFKLYLTTLESTTRTVKSWNDIQPRTRCYTHARIRTRTSTLVYTRARLRTDIRSYILLHLIVFTTFKSRVLGFYVFGLLFFHVLFFKAFSYFAFFSFLVFFLLYKFFILGLFSYISIIFFRH